MATITDNFNRADADGLGSSSEGWSWTEVQGDIDIVSNVARGGSNAAGSARAELSLGSADHYAQLNGVFAGSNGCGPCVRFAAGAATYYVAYYDVAQTRIFKVVGGSLSNLGTVTNYNGGVLRLRVTGSTIEAFDDGVSLGSVTDGDITGNTRTGIRADGVNDVMDDFEASDGLSGGADQPTIRRFGLAKYIGSPAPTGVKGVAIMQDTRRAA